jgi:hypothetical protein
MDGWNWMRLIIHSALFELFLEDVAFLELEIDERYYWSAWHACIGSSVFMLVLRSVLPSQVVEDTPTSDYHTLRAGNRSASIKIPK